MSSTLANARSTIPNDCKTAGDCGEFEIGIELVERRGWTWSAKIPCVCVMLFNVVDVVQQNGRFAQLS